MISKLLAFATTGAIPVVAIVAASQGKFFAQSNQVQNKLTGGTSEREQVTPPKESSPKKEKKLDVDKEQDNCQDEKIMIVVQSSKGDSQKVPLKELSKYLAQGYKPLEADYEVGTCSKPTSPIE